MVTIFKIAERFKEGIYLFNLNGYSHTTAIHKNHVQRALSCDTLIYLKDCDINKVKETIKDNNAEILNLKDKSSRARKDHIKEMYKNAILNLEEQNVLIKEHILGETTI